MPSSERLILPPGIGCWPYLFHPRPPMKTSANPRALYQIVLLWPKDQKEFLAPLAAAVKGVAAEAFGANPKGKIRFPLRDGDVDRAEYPEFRNALFATLSSEKKPGLVDADGQPIFEADADEEAYAGCTFRASAVAFSYDVEGNRGVSVGLRNLQVVLKGPRLDGGRSAEDEFAEFVEPGAAKGGKSDVDDLVG